MDYESEVSNTQLSVFYTWKGFTRLNPDLHDEGIISSLSPDNVYIKRLILDHFIKMFKAIDHTTKRSLGELVLPLKTILREPNLELFEQTFPLTQGVHQSPMVITARIRVNYLG